METLGESHRVGLGTTGQTLTETPNQVGLIVAPPFRLPYHLFGLGRYDSECSVYSGTVVLVFCLSFWLPGRL